MTDCFFELYRKAYQFAEFFEYDLIAIPECGSFQFYNSPCCRSFSFTVDPHTFSNTAPASFIFNEFKKP